VRRAKNGARLLRLGPSMPPNEKQLLLWTYLFIGINFPLKTLVLLWATGLNMRKQ